jgi:uncharacterized membrane protein YedE/YeeE
MRNILYLIAGIVFGVVLTKTEAISWFRIQEMFRFDSFHMYGIFMTAIPTAAIGVLLIKKLKLHSLDNAIIEIPEKKFHRGIIIGGLIFGFGWAFTGACPGPIYAQIGAGYSVAIVTFLSALAGTFTFGLFEKYLT